MKANPEDLSKLLSSAALVFVGTIVGSGASLLERVVVGRLLSPSAYGEFSIGIAILTLGGTLGAAGFTQGVPRFMARFSDTDDIRGAWLTGAAISIGLSVLVTAALIGGAPVIVPRIFETEEALWMYYLLAMTIPIYVSFRIGIGAIRGMENTQYKILAQDLSYPVLRVSLLAMFLSAGLGLIGTGLAYLTSVIFVALVTYFLLNRLLPLLGPFQLHSREMTAFSIPLIVSTIMAALLTRTDTLMLGYFRASSEVGIYNAAYPLATILSVVLGAFGYMYLPIASRLDSGEEGSVERVYEITTKWIFLLIFPAFVTLITFPDRIISIVFGAEYVAGGQALAILAFGFFTNAAVGRNRETLSALGATTFILVSNVVAFLVNVSMNLILIPLYGFMGAAVASATSYVALNIVVFVYLRSRFGITPFNRSSIRAYLALPIVLIPVGLLVRRVFPETILFITTFTVLMGVLSIVVVAYVRGFEPEDAVLLNFIEESTSVTIPFIRRYIPDDLKR